MKILLLGEFSGLHRWLKEGLVELGHDVTLIANGDGWKKTGGQDDLLKKKNNYKNIFEKFYYLIAEPCLSKNRYCNYDIVQLIHPSVFHWAVNYAILKYIKKNCNKLFLCAAGSDYYTYQAYCNNKYRYYVYDDDEQTLEYYNKRGWRGRALRMDEMAVTNLADGIIPISYEYAESHRHLANYCNIISLPINTDTITYQENNFNKRIVIFHGISRDKVKGTEYIVKALEIIKQKYQADVEIIIDGKMPFADYIEFISKTNIVIDQCKSYGYGMNAGIAMAKGRVVLSGAEPEALNELGLSDCPVINIKPEVNDIVNKLERLIKERQSIPEKGYLSRKFIEAHHDYRLVANKYIDCWSNC